MARRGGTLPVGGAGGGHVVDCSTVRPDLPEHALGTLSPERRRTIDAHLAWCAGCRKEARELAEGAAAVGLLVAPGRPLPGLEERVVRAVSRRGSPRRSRIAAVGVAAALLLAAITGAWAVAMRQRVRELADAAVGARERASRFESTLREIVDEQGGGRILSAPLSTGRVGPGPGGRAILFDARRGEDWVLVIVGGLPEAPGPYRGYVVTEGRRLLLGRLWPSAPEEMTAYRIFPRHDLAPSDGIVILDRDGHVALRGMLSAGA
ncbi:MAG: anti-sigma factor family protein [Actinomycetota bacterium]